MSICAWTRIDSIISVTSLICLSRSSSASFVEGIVITGSVSELVSWLGILSSEDWTPEVAIVIFWSW